MPLQIRAPVVSVYLGGKLDHNANALSASIGSGADGLATAEILIEPVARLTGRTKLENIDLADFEQPEVEIVIEPDTGPERVIYCGNVLARHVTLGEGGDYITLIARVDDHHFGLPLQKSSYWDGRTSKEIELHLPTIFNPDIDGVIMPNRADKVFSGGGKTGCPLFIHPESTRTEAAKKFAESKTVKAWTLPEAAYYLCQTLNSGAVPGGRLIDNPTFHELRSELPEDESLLRNFEMPFGDYLPAQLDALLTPFGFSWTVESTARGKRKIVVFERGTGAFADIKLQKAGEDADVNKSNLEGLSLTVDVANRSFNAVSVVGEYERYEGTFQLIKAWSEDYDDHNGETENDEGQLINDLTKNAPGWKTDSKLSRVWRDWVLNEAGDYNDVRDGYKTADLDHVFGAGKYVAHRRRFEPCLTNQEDGSPYGHAAGIFIEWSDDAGLTWRKLDEMSAEGRQVVILDRECGVRFNGDEIPMELWIAGDAARVRVTACLDSDTRVVSTVPKRPSLFSALKTEALSVGSKFKYRKRLTTSALVPYTTTGTFSPEGKAVTEQDDRSLTNKLAAQLLDRQNVATIGGTLQLFGVDHFGVKIGQRVAKIVGRQIGFQVNSGIARHPSIVAMRFNFQNQSTDVVLDTYRGGGL